MYSDTRQNTVIQEANTLVIFEKTDIRIHDYPSQMIPDSVKGCTLKYTMVSTFSQRGQHAHQPIYYALSESLKSIADANKGILSLGNSSIQPDRRTIRKFVGEGEWNLIWQNLTDSEILEKYKTIEVTVFKNLSSTYIPGSTHIPYPVSDKTTRVVDKAFEFIREVHGLHDYLQNRLKTLPIIEYHTKGGLYDYMFNIPTISSDAILLKNPGV